MKTSWCPLLWQLHHSATRAKQNLLRGLVVLALCAGCTRQDSSEPSVPQFGPPAPIQDQVAPCPGSMAAWTWIPGEYRWEGNFYRWHSGIWVRRPAPEARWRPGQWLPRTYGWTYQAGYWY